ncbi:DDE-type integrase/transposase/recombinase [Desulfitobacterium hafniense]|nr:DDE-type integrase/transposase/recombinase [Desulfitobacterium hafniense]
MTKVSMKARKEIISKHAGRYRKASKKGKMEILNYVCSATGLSRDRAARVLRGEKRPKTKHSSRKKSGRPRVYDFEVCQALKTIWTIMDFACGKRLAEAMEDILDALLRFGELRCSEDTLRKLRRMSASSIDRLLKKDKASLRLKGLSTTKPGTLLKRDIPIRLGQQWDDAVPGYVEVDLVAHCGASTAGEYVNTLNVTDICTGWTEPVAVLNKAQKHVFAGLMAVQDRQPFPYLGIDSDNGSEFINHELKRYCDQEGICFTRSRPYTKNDGCHVEQKNWSLVRRHIGYGRYEGQAALALLNQYYGLLRRYVNFFQPSTKLIEKQRIGAKVLKRYEKPQTPYKRVLADNHIPDTVKDNLTHAFQQINPAQLMRDMQRVKTELERYGLS